MANPQQVEMLLHDGVAVWNLWRKENPDVRPDLHEAELFMADLHDAALHGAELRNTNLRNANLRNIAIASPEDQPVCAHRVLGQHGAHGQRAEPHRSYSVELHDVALLVACPFARTTMPATAPATERVT